MSFHLKTNRILVLGTQCTAWPKSRFGRCAPDDKNYKVLDKHMSFSDSASCERLCLEQQAAGCCYLRPGAGCLWKLGGYATVGGTGTAVTCRMGKRRYFCLFVLYFSV